jgi:23S rRNA (cytosine1962-C5)-methyltransferase
MTTYPILKLKPGRDPHLKNRHHAVFQTSVSKFPDCPDGSIVEVQGSDGGFLCYATLNRKAYICARAIAFGKGDPMKELRATMQRSIDLRREFFKKEDTNAYRLINAEGDGVPGLIVDRYNSVVVIQLTTKGMDNLRDWIVSTLHDMLKPTAIFEKSAGPGRKKEGMEPIEGWVKGKGPDTITVKERGLTYLITLMGSQKTGLFLDQREMRSLVKRLAEGRTVLDCCSYVGGFSLNALMGGAKSADAVDYDKVAIDKATQHMKLNGAKPGTFGGYAEDVFAFLRRKPLPKQYDFIVLDPPAFAKRSTDIDRAKYAYTDLNRMAMEALKPGSLLLTCSCSYQIDHQLFQTIVFHAAQQSRRNVRILERHRQAYDHPVNIFHPEVDYLKSLLLWVE